MKIRNVCIKGVVLFMAGTMLFTGCGKSNKEKLIGKMFDNGNPQKAKTLNVYSYIDMSSAYSDSIIYENDWNIVYQILGDSDFKARITGNHSMVSTDDLVSKNDDVFYINKENSKSYYLCDEEEWYREEVPFDAYLDIDGKSVSVLKDTLRSIWNNAELSENVETLGGKTCYVFNAEITGNDYVQLLDFYMTGMNKEDEWNQFVEYFQQNNKRTSMESFLENCHASLVGYVDKATGKLKVVDVNIDYIPVNEALYSIDILPEDNQIISNVTENDYVINSMFFSISFLNDQESIEIPEGINFEQ